MLYYIGIGTNIGNKQNNIDLALRMLAQRAGTILARSGDFVSEPWGFKSENNFLNIVIALETSLAPLDLLHTTQAIELEMGRQHKSVNGIYHDRIIDIDLLQADGIRLQTDELTLPHPLIEQRDFVRIPLSEVKQLLTSN